MTDAGREDYPATAANDGKGPAKKRRFTPLRIGLLGIGTVFVLLQVLSTENRVRYLRSIGLPDVAIDNTRAHAYLPIIGAFVGVLVFMLAFIAIKRVIHEIRK